GGHVARGRAVERARRNDNEEVRGEALPVDLAETRHARVEFHALHVERDVAADGDAEMAGGRLLDRGLRRGPPAVAPPLTSGDDVSGRQRGGRREDVVTREVSEAVVTSHSPLLHERASDRVSVQCRQPGAHYRCDGGRDPGDVMHDADETIALPPLEVD